MFDDITISKQKPSDPAFDYDELRKAGIAYIEQTASAIWTDYNIHDPGITTLELLCYAITDLSYRTNNSIPDLLATETDTVKNIRKHFFSAAQILPNNAVTINDYRKLLIDIDGVKNAWLTKRTKPVYADIIRKKLQFDVPDSQRWEKVEIKGYYDVLIEFDTNIINASKANIKNTVRRQLMANRNLCEDFVDINEVTAQQFRMCSEIELKNNADPFNVLAQIFFNIQQHLTPLINFYWLRDILAQGISADAIFEGPLLTHGFIKDEELANSDLKTEIHLSDIMQQILAVDGVANITDIVFNTTGQVDALKNKWIIDVEDGKQPVVNILGSNILFYKEGIPFRPDLNVVKARFDKLMNAAISGNDQVKTDDIVYDTGNYVDAGNYYSIQNHFPKNYGISHWGLPSDATPERKIQARQLQGYLYLFDQQLACYFSQLSHLRNLLSTDDEQNTYFSQVVTSFKDANELFVNPALVAANIQTVADAGTFNKRRNMFLDHLLSRFAETFYDYVSVLNTGLSAGNKSQISPAIVNERDIITTKINFLKDYPAVSGKRFAAYNYTNTAALWNSANISGLENRLQRLLGFKNIQRRSLVNVYSTIKKGLNAANLDEYWYQIIDNKTKTVLLEGAQRFPLKESAEYDRDDAIELLSTFSNLSVIKNADNSFSYILKKAGVVVGKSGVTYPNTNTAKTTMNNFYKLMALSQSDEGMFLVEHLLLLPEKSVATPASPPQPTVDPFLPICVDSNCRDCDDKDPYSFRISIVLPAYAPRFLNMDFRRYCERIIRMEAPAHTFVKICWVSNEQLVIFERDYKNWLDVKAGKVDAGNVRLNQFVKTLTALKTIYPPAKLEDCKNSAERQLFILNQNALGTLKT
ncbi:hypothetical protein IM792_19305 [Mucilaginibacter sp. JRF]|uniref:hypothetical protein n=1 Tax=Mucilaginibacter sp. JRF TaxID=2780088 RepID=UPI001881BFF3|nr:hypothetical protein [Mucilaginibacter sp. JRF]MBE9586605.1 hypothetical protein [Mucilaginibacter sp. JRF]